jgi:transcriptional regulator with XRE-family HTH domain
MAAKRFPMRLKQLREAKSWRQAKLADEAGVTREYIARFETGKHDPPLSRVEKLANVLKVPIGRLLKRPSQTASQSVMIYALDDQGNVWKCVEGGQPRVSEPKWILMKYERQR